jgi:dihydroorotate dehydrogenase
LNQINLDGLDMENIKLEVNIGNLKLKNPIICGSGEHLIEEAGILKALESGASMVVAKSANENESARKQLHKTDYAMIDQDINKVDWDKRGKRDLSLFGRSGLVGEETESWLQKIALFDRQARKYDSYVAVSLIPARIDCLIKHAELTQTLGIRVLELNIGAPHGTETQDSIQLILQSEKIKEVVKSVRRVFHGHLLVKMPGMSENVSQLSSTAKQSGADAVVMMGRMMAMIPDLKSMKPILGTNGAYGGRWALPITCRWLSESRQLLGGDYPLIGTNGARNGYDVARMMLAGASAVELTSIVFSQGFEVVESSIKELQSYLEKKKINAKNLIGISSDQVQSYSEQNVNSEYWKRFVPEDSLN